MERSQKLSMTFTLIGVASSVIAIFAFLTGIGSIPSLIRKPQPVAKPAPPTVVVVQPALTVPEQKKSSLGDQVVAPVKNGVDWAAKRLTPRKRSKDALPNEPAGNIKN